MQNLHVKNRIIMIIHIKINATQLSVHRSYEIIEFMKSLIIHIVTWFYRPTHNIYLAKYNS